MDEIIIGLLTVFGSICIAALLSAAILTLIHKLEEKEQNNKWIN